MNKYYFFLLLFSGIFYFAKGQNNLNPILVKKISGSFSYFKRDESGNVFAVTSSGQLKKYNMNLDSMGVFNDIRGLGNVDNVTSINSLRTFTSSATTVSVPSSSTTDTVISSTKSGAYGAS